MKKLRLMLYPDKQGERVYSIETPWTDPYGGGWMVLENFTSRDRAEEAFRKMTEKEPVVLKEFDTYHYEKGADV